jgi:hypothetical protein
VERKDRRPSAFLVGFIAKVLLTGQSELTRQFYKRGRC